jgi:hypothetical protein
VKRKRQEQFTGIDAWLQRLYAERPFVFNLLVLAIAAVFLALAYLLGMWKGAGH